MSTEDKPTNGTKVRAEFWMKVAAGAFGLWAFAIPIGVEILRGVLRDIQAEIHIQTGKATEYRLATERRIVILEERHARLTADSEARIAMLERELGVSAREPRPRR